jgi:uncharacterized small protein (DUF1192 family)
MAIDPEDAIFGRPKPKPAAHVLGEPLDTFSAAELASRIDALKQEIERLEEAIRARAATHAAAAAFFKS